jgi:hypothetical protein
MIHSPFHVVEDFISPLQCEQLIKGLGLLTPDLAENGQPLRHQRLVPALQAGSVLNAFEEIVPFVEQRYGGMVGQARHLVFQQYWENPKAPAETHWAEGWKYTRKKWVKLDDVDLVGFIWLKDFHGSAPLDPRVEVYGGKLEFPTYNFSLTPSRGTLVMYPATPHFVTAMSHVLLGSLEQLKLTVKLTVDGGQWSYAADKFPGSYREWFVEE